MPGRRVRVSTSVVGVAVLSAMLFTSGCTGEPEPDIDDLGRTLAKDGRYLVEEAKVMAPVNYDGRITFLDRPGNRNVACAEDGTVKRVFEGHGVGEWGSPVRLSITGDTLLGTLVQRDYEVDRFDKLRPEDKQYRLKLSKAGGDLTFRIVVDDGEPVRWRAVGETTCVPAT